MTGIDSRHRWRKPMRSPGFDYREPGPYFVTICSSRHAVRFGTVVNRELQPNDAGLMILSAWRSLPTVFPGTWLDAAVVMPNHLHGLLTLPLPDGSSLDGQPTLTDIVHWFKTESTNRYIRGVMRSGWPRYDRHLWQPGFHDRIIRSDSHLDRARAYIAANPAKWETDEYFAGPPDSR